MLRRVDVWSGALVLSALWGLQGCDDGASSEGAGGRGGEDPGQGGEAGQGGAPLGPPTVGDLVIEEVFYAGSPGLVEHTFNDQFIDVRNDSDGVIYLDGLLVGDAFGAAGEINPGQPTSPFRDDPDFVYLSNVFRIPGSGTDHPLLPGETVTLAHDGTNHQPDSVLDLSGADFEAFIESSGKDDDWPTVPNLEVVHFTGGFDWLMPVFGPAVVIARVDDPATLERVPEPGFPDYELVALPIEAVVDGVECLMDGDSEDYKRLPPGVDATFVYVSDTYTGESVRRRVGSDEVPTLVDTGSSAADFEVLAVPEPGQ